MRTTARLTIAAVVPARNEAGVIGRSLASLLQQICVDALHVVVVDDNSSDATANVAKEVASRNRVTVIAGRPLPSGWSGKLWAVQQGIEQALELNPDFLLLTDADIEHSRDNVARLVEIAQTGNYDLASFMVRLHCHSLAEKLLIPAFVFFFFMLYPPKWIRDPRRKTAGAAGGCMLIRPAALERAGGVAAIRHEIIDDCALARAVKRSGGKVWLGLTAETHSLRAYNSFAEIERMIARTAFNQLGHSVWLLLATVLAMLLVFVCPIVLIATRSPLLAFIGAAVYLLLSAAYLPMVHFYRLNPLWALTLPLSAIFYVAATIHSALKYWSGRGGEWKGRSQDVGPAV
ncbi:MAG TPA: glycosyltransferase [Terriglobales bacterium]|nr:glycosyltransferase [Terriglobales bacterium]